MRTHIIGARYYLSRRDFRASLVRLCATLAPLSGEITTCAVDLELGAAEQVAADDWLAGSGPFLDVSGYARGVARHVDADVHVLLNDTLFTKHPTSYLAGELGRLLEPIAFAPTAAAAGMAHPSTDLLLVDRDNPTRQHLSTFFFALNRQAFAQLAGLCDSLPDPSADPIGARWLADRCAKHPALRSLIHFHLEAPANRWSWAGRERADSALRARKAVTVAFEYLLTQKLLSVGGVVLPIACGRRFALARFLAPVERMMRRAGRAAPEVVGSGRRSAGG